MSEINGIIPIKKECGMTSHDVVMKARRILRTKKIGHTGTLDPDVTGVLPICIGKGTRIVQFLTEDTKEYVCDVSIGRSTTTEDASGEVVEKDLSEKHFSRQEILDVLQKLTGDIVQIPPMYSAVKVNGKKLYEYARAGIEVERKPRNVTVFELELCSDEEEFMGNEPKFQFRVLCSKGTYVRTLAVTIGEMLGYPAHMHQLVRTKAGAFSINECVTLDELQEKVENNQINQVLFPLEKGLEQMPHVILTSDQIADVKNGKKLFLSKELRKEQFIAVFSEAGTCYGVYEPYENHDKLFAPVRIFISANEE